MPYGFGGGLAAGFESGIDSGTRIAEVRMRREALMKEQMSEQIKRVGTLIEGGLKNIETTVTKAAQRNPNLESAVEAQKAQLVDAATILKGLGPEGEQAAQYYLSTINSIVPSFRTLSEANMDKHLAEESGAYQASQMGDQIYGQTAGPVTPETPITTVAQAQSAVDQQNAPMGAPAPTQVAQAPGHPMSQQDLYKKFSGQQDGEGSKLASGAEGRVALLQKGTAALESVDPESGVKLGEFLSKPSQWSLPQAAGLPSRWAGGELQRAQNAGLEVARAAFYALTGAAAPDNETKQLFQLFIPSYMDDDKTAAAKVKGMYEYAGRAMRIYQTRNGAPITKEEAMMIAGMPADDAYGATMTATPQEGGVGSSATAAPAAPEVGTVEDGYRFKGGNPADPNSWEPVQ